MRYALVTGGSRGIGRAICCKLAEMGFYVLVNYNSSPDEAETTLNLIKEKGGDGELLKFDVARQEEVESALGDGSPIMKEKRSRSLLIMQEYARMRC